MGNGSFWLLALEGQKLRILLHTRAVDRHWGDDAGEAFRDGQMRVQYLDSDPNEPLKVELQGIINTLGEEEKITSSRKVSELWSWDKAQRVFVRSDR